MSSKVAQRTPHESGWGVDPERAADTTPSRLRGRRAGPRPLPAADGRHGAQRGRHQRRGQHDRGERQGVRRPVARAAQDTRRRTPATPSTCPTTPAASATWRAWPPTSASPTRATCTVCCAARPAARPRRCAPCRLSRLSRPGSLRRQSPSERSAARTVSAELRSAPASWSVSGGVSTASTPVPSTIDGRDRQTSSMPYWPLSSEETGRMLRSSWRTASMIPAVGEPDREVRRALAADDLLGGGDHLVRDAVERPVVERRPSRHRPVADRHAADRRLTPRGDLRVTVLADDERVHAVHGDAAVLGEQRPQAGGVEHGPGAEHPPARQPGRLHGGIGDDVDGVGDQQEHGVRRELDERGHQRPAHLDVHGRQLEPRLARLLLRPSGDHHDVGVRRHRDVVGPDHVRGGIELAALVEIQHLGADLVAMDVVQRHRVGHAPDQRRVGDRRPDAAGTDH